MKVKENIFYVGTDDKTLDWFEGQYMIPEGISYNSYVIKDEKITVMDAVDIRCGDQWLQQVEEVLQGQQPSYLVVLHVEPDHASSVVKFLQTYKDCQCVTSAKAQQFLGQFFDYDFSGRFLTIKEGDELSLGKHTLQFMAAPMVHWPEVMVAYETTEKILFAADGFGKFGALDGQLYQTTTEGWACEARRYYFNIVGKYGQQVQGLLKKAAALDIKTIAPLHGPILENDLSYYLNLYQIWSSYQAESQGVFIAYCSLHGHTQQVALELEKLLSEQGVDVAITDLVRSDMAEAVEDAFRYDRMVLAAPTYDGGVMPKMEEFLHHLKAKNFRNRKIGIIENGTWAPMAAKTMCAILEQMNNITIVEPKVSIRSAMKEADKETLKQLAAAML